jgi:hypothetical protein
MYAQYGGTLPVYAGTRYQRGGGILSSLASFVMPAAKKLLAETYKAAPVVINAIASGKQGTKDALLSGFKRAGTNTLQQTFGGKARRVTNRTRQTPPRRRKQAQPRVNRRKKAQRGGDIFG